MAKKKTSRPRARSAAKPARTADLPTLRRTVARLVAAREAEARRHARQLAAVRRDTDRRLTGMVQEIATLRHHEARAEALTRLLADREQEIARLLASLDNATTQPRV